MIEAPKGVDLWTDIMGDAIVITTNGDINASGRAVMGRGCALEAKTRFKDIDMMLARRIKSGGNHVHIIGYPVYANDFEFALTSFPVKHHWQELADLKLIERSAHELLALTEAEEWDTVVMPRPGCGNGRLQWETVRPVLASILPGDRFVIVHK